MSLKEFLNSLREIEIDLAWSHWNHLGVSGQGKVNKCSTDPEALLVLTSIVGKHDLRLVSVMNEWLCNYESLVSIERLKRYIKELLAGKDAQINIFDILRKTLENLNTKRWQSVFNLIGKQPKRISTNNQKPSRKKLENHDKIITANRQLFLRLMFGVGSRADIIYYAGVVWNQGKNPFSLKISAPHVTRMLHYNNSTIFRTLCDLEQAGVLVVDPKTIGGKNKVYLPNMQLKDSKDIFGAGKSEEKAFIDWFAIAKICLLIESLEGKLESASEELIKTRLNNFITSCSDLMNSARIDIKASLNMKALYPALVHIGLDELQSKVTSQVGGMYGFVTL